MNVIAKPLTDADIAALAAWYSAIKRRGVAAALIRIRGFDDRASLRSRRALPWQKLADCLSYPA